MSITEEERAHHEMMQKMQGTPSPDPTSMDRAAEYAERMARLQYEEQRAKMQQLQHPVHPGPSTSDRLKDIEDFIKYAAEVSPDFEKLVTGFRAMRRIGIK